MISRRVLAVSFAAALIPSAAVAQRRRRVVVRRTRVVVHPGHPIARVVNRQVLVRRPARVVVVGAPLRYLPVVAFTAAAVAITLPPRERLIWQDVETIEREEDWVESNFGVDEGGDALYLEIDGRAELDFADITFENGEVQSIDFNEGTYSRGLHRLLDFPGRRQVKTVRLVARSKSEHTTLKVYLSK